MTQIISFTEQTPPPRYDDVPWTQVRIEEASTLSGSYTVIDTVALADTDADPSDPQPQSFTTPNGTGPALWYRLTWIDANGGLSATETPIQNGTFTTYTDTTELARILKIRSPAADQTAAMQRVIESAALEINAEIGRPAGLTSLELQLAAEVNLERAAELWKEEEIQFGLIGIGTEFPTRIGRDTWERHANKLAPLKGQWGLA